MARPPNIKPLLTPAGWMVSIPQSLNPDGKSRKKYFQTESSANRFAARGRSTYTSGQRGSVLPLNLAIQAGEAIQILDGTCVSGVPAVKHYYLIEHLRATVS